MNLSLLNIYGPSFINDLLTFSYSPASVSFFLRIENLRKIQASKGKKKRGERDYRSRKQEEGSQRHKGLRLIPRQFTDYNDWERDKVFPRGRKGRREKRQRGGILRYINCYV